MKVKLCISIICITFLSFESQCQTQEEKNDASTLINNGFAWKLFRKSRVPNRQTENFVLSPLTIQHLLSVLQYAAEGTTKDQINQVTENVNPTQLYYILNPTDVFPEVKSASGIFIDSNDRVTENASLHIFINGGDIYLVPLQNDPKKARNIINSWASNATEGHVLDFLKSDSDVASLRALLASAIYFHSSWKHQFKISKPQKFYTTFNGEVLADYMHVEAYLKKKNINVDKKNNWATVINLPYKENRYSMFLIIPGPLTDLNTFLETLSFEKFSEIISNPLRQPSTKLKLFLPKFKVSSKISLVSSLQKMGLTDIFSASKSRLTNLLDGHEALRINEILQQSTLEVDQFGTTATSVTSFSVVPLSAAEPEAEEFVIDSPFLAVIVENANQIPIFIASITNPLSDAIF